MSQYIRSKFKLDVQQDSIDVTSERETPNELWRYTDAAGHEHFYRNGYPTLTLIVDEAHWCDGTEGPYNHDPHEAVDRAHYECPECGEHVVPMMDPPYTPKYIPGMIDARLSGPLSNDPRRFREIGLGPDEVERITERIEQDRGSLDDLLQEFIDNASSDRTIRWWIRA